jgi:hypothetical protein
MRVPGGINGVEAWFQSWIHSVLFVGVVVIVGPLLRFLVAAFDSA